MRVRTTDKMGIPRNRKYLLLWFFLLFSFPVLMAQDLPYSQYSFTPLKVNPALVSAPQTTEISFLYRQRHIGPNAGWHATQFTLSQPLMSDGRKWGGLGLQVSDDQTGKSPFFRTQNVTAAFAYSLPLSPRQSLSFGVSGAFETKRTPPQGVRNGESFRAPPSPAVKLNSGLYYRGTDGRGREVFYFGLALIQSNHPHDNVTFYNKVPSTFLLSAGFNAWQSQSLTLTPQLLWNNRAGHNFLHLGGKLNFSWAGLKAPLLRREGSVDLGVGYVIEEILVLALTLHQPLYTLGFSYDLDLNPRDGGHPFRRGPEVGLRIFPQTAFHRLKASVENRRDKKALPLKNSQAISRQVPTPPASSPQPNHQPGEEEAPRLPAQLADQPGVKEASPIEESLLQFQKKSLYFDSDKKLLEDAEQGTFLQDLAHFLNQHPALSIRIIGHTDDTGTETGNIMLSFRRAQRIAELLMEEGIQGERMVVEGHGSFNPLVPNTSAENRAFNRRVQFIFENLEVGE